MDQTQQQQILLKIQDVQGSSPFIWSIKFDNKNQFLLTINSTDVEVREWNLNRNKIIQTLQNESNEPLSSISINKDNNIVVTVAWGKEIYIFKKRERVWVLFQKIQSRIVSVEFLNNNNSLVTGTLDKKLIFWSQIENKYQLQKSINCNSPVISIGMNKNNNQIVTGQVNGQVIVYKLINSEWEQSQKLNGHYEEVRTISFYSNQNMFVSASFDKTIRVYKENEQGQYQLLQRLNNHIEDVWCAIFHQQQNIIFSGGQDKVIRVWKYEENKNKYQEIQQVNTLSTILSLAIDQDGTQLAVGLKNGGVRTYKIQL